nr:MAG TPA: hypothetical protein [Caudoviricetes sp.]
MILIFYIYRISLFDTFNNKNDIKIGKKDTFVLIFDINRV